MCVICVYMCLSVCIYVCVGVHAHVCPWKPEVDMESTHGQPQALLSLDFETGYVTELVVHGFF